LISGSLFMRRFTFGMVVIGDGVATTAAQAQIYPNRPIRILVPFAAGGAVDVLARLIGAKLADGLGQTVIIETGLAPAAISHPTCSQNRRPTATPSSLQQEAVKVLNLPDVIEHLRAGGNENVGSTPEEFEARFKADTASSRKSSKTPRFRSRTRCEVSTGCSPADRVC
jgi:tripartite-type tricarboxylate transporter receptor subunit TctC